MTSFEDGYEFREAVDLMLDETLERVSATTKQFLKKPTSGNIERVAGASLDHMRAFGIAIDQIMEHRPDLTERLAMINNFASAAEEERVRVINEAAGTEVCEVLPLAYYLTDDEEVVLAHPPEESEAVRPVNVLNEVSLDDLTEEELNRTIKEGIMAAYYGNIAGDLLTLRLFKASHGVGRIIFWGERLGEHSGDIAKIATGVAIGMRLAKRVDRK